MNAGPTDRPAMRRAMTGILTARALCGAATLAFAAWVGGAWGAAVGAVAVIYLAAVAYWFRRSRAGRWG